MRSLRVKLTLALLVTGLSGVLIITAFVQKYTTSEFDNFIFEQTRANFIADMTTYYELYGSWDDMALARGRIPIPPPNGGNPVPDRITTSPPGGFQFQFMLLDQDGTIIFPDRNFGPPDQQLPTVDLNQADPIVVDGETVGYVVVDAQWLARDEFEQRYLRRVNWVLVAAAGGALGIALLLSFGFARSLSNPLREITTAIQSISRGDLDQKVPVRTRDEVGQVAAAFNQMSADLAQAHHLRRQMTADIAHELRTPLSVIVGYLASLSEELLQPSLARFKTMHDEAQHLQRLVDDLRTLSLADAGELMLNVRPIEPGELVQRTAAMFSHQAEQRSITLAVEVAPDLAPVPADPDRLMQVLSNLLSNALRHTPAQGRITVGACAEQSQLVLSVSDTGPGIAPEHVPHIFERFYRADAARHQTQNESGLGLAIAKSIVVAHGGSVDVTSTVGQGTTFRVLLPTNAAHGPQTYKLNTQ